MALNRNRNRNQPVVPTIQNRPLPGGSVEEALKELEKAFGGDKDARKIVKLMREGRARFHIWRGTTPWNRFVMYTSERGNHLWHSSDSDYGPSPLAFFVEVEQSTSQVNVGGLFSKPRMSPFESVFVLRKELTLEPKATKKSSSRHLAFPGIPDSLYMIAIQPAENAKGKRRVTVWGTRTSLKKAKEEAKHAKSMHGDRRVLVISYDRRRRGFGVTAPKRTWEVK